MISFDEAVALIAQTAQPLGREAVPIRAAHGRVLAEPVIAGIDSPPADVSAMDGYAVRSGDLSSLPVRLEIVGESFAGSGWNGELRKGQCVRIFTGAPVPASADRIVMQEDVVRDGAAALFEQPIGATRHIRARGGDFSRGEELLPAGRLLDARGIVAAAAADLAFVEAFRQPAVHILSTGDELAEPGTAFGSARIPESVSFGVAAIATEWQANVSGTQRLGDNLPYLERAAAEAAAGADLVVVTGGASVGEKDYAKAMFETLGLDLVFSKVAIKPGKPVWLGRAERTLVIGLPGNPTSALVTARLLLAPLLAGLCGRSPEDALRWRTAALASPIERCGSRETFVRGRWSGEAVEMLGFQDSSAQKELAQADVLIRRLPDAPALATGDSVQVLEF